MKKTCSVENLSVGIGRLALVLVVFASLLFSIVGLVLASAELNHLLGGQFAPTSLPHWVLVLSGLSVAGWGALLAYKAFSELLGVFAEMVAICACVRYLDWLTHTLMAYHQSTSFIGVLLVWHVPFWVHLAVLPVRVLSAFIFLVLSVGLALGCRAALERICRLGAAAR